MVVTLCLPGEEPADDLVGTVYSRDVLGVTVPQVYVVVEPGRDLANVIEAAALNQKLRRLGHDAEKELDARLVAMLSEGREVSD
jgi:serine kinase of HPr protein (carbohydrate metabolism regulator)